MNLSLKDFLSPVVNKKCFYSLICGRRFRGYLRCMIGLDGNESRRIKLSDLSGKLLKEMPIIIDKQYVGVDPLCDEWIEHIPNVRKYNQDLNALLALAKRKSASTSRQDSPRSGTVAISNVRAPGLLRNSSDPTLRPSSAVHSRGARPATAARRSNLFQGEPQQQLLQPPQHNMNHLGPFSFQNFNQARPSRQPSNDFTN